MAINKHDDYEALARLLYPSIEASGNVYYGQTRKLTLDEVLKRNSLGFDSHIESFYNDNGGYYDSYFCWRLGSLHGSVRVDPFTDSVTVDNFSVDFIKRILYADSEEIIYDNNLIYKSSQADPDEDYTLDTSTIPIFGTIFAKYRLDKHSTTVTNELNSGSYDSYEIDVEPVLDGLYVTDDFNPVNSIDDDISERHFYISKENGVDYLYIQILTSKDTGKILTFTALEDSEISLSMSQPTTGSRTVYYRVSDGGIFPDTWEIYHYDWVMVAEPTGSISLSSGQSIQFKSDIEDAVLFNNTDDCLKFVVDSGTVFVSGSCMSMCHPDIDESTIDSLDDYALLGLFSDVENMYGTPVLPNVRELGIRCYSYMFHNCTSLTVAPKLKSSITYNTGACYANMFNGCVSLVSPPKMMGYDNTDQYYHSGVGTCSGMFIGCTSLKSSPVIHYKTLDSSSCYQMFNGCSSLKIIQCGAKYAQSSATILWVNGVSSNGIFIKSSVNYYSGANGIPTGWTVVTKDDEYFAVHKDPETGFRIDKHIPSWYYKNDYLVTSGTDSETNGRGYIANFGGTDDTIGKMERSFDENGTHKMNTYNSDGSFNQEIWGYKTFNSPVQFRNGLYGEDWSIYTFDYDISDFRVSKKSTVISRDTSESASIQIYRGYNYLSGSTNSIILSTEKPRATYDTDETIATIEVSSTKSQYESDSTIIEMADTIELRSTDLSNGNIKLNSKNVIVGMSSGWSNINPANSAVSIGSSSLPFNSIYANRFYGLFPYPYRESTATLGNREPEYSTQLLYLTYNAYDQAGHLYEHNHDLTFEIITLNGDTTTLTIRSNNTNSTRSYLKCEVNGSARTISWNSLEATIDNLRKGDKISFYTTNDIAASVKFTFYATFGTYANVSGNPASVYYKNEDHTGYSKVTRDSAFEEMFKPPINHGFIYDASKLCIDGTGENLCKRMFYGHYTLAYPPLAMWCEGDNCCREMFASTGICYTPINCHNNSYQSMYYKMFESCSNLKYGAFMVSTAAMAVDSMFSLCSNLKEISILHTDSSFSAINSSTIDSYGYSNLAPVQSESDPSQTVTNARIYSTFRNANIQNSYTRDLSVEAAIAASFNMIPGDKVRIMHYDYGVFELYSASLRISSSSIQPHAGDILGGSYILLSSTRDRELTSSQLYDYIVMGVRSEK